MTYYQRNLPHWVPEGKPVFLTWRLYGSLPVGLLRQLKDRKEAPRRQFLRAERCLDVGGFGPLWLKEPAIAESVRASILRGAEGLGQYRLLAFVVMPNHVHMLIEPRVPLERITRGLKGFTAFQANRFLNRGGQPFWQDESFDHWVRHAAEGEKICRYIENNPVKAGLADLPSAWLWSSATKPR